METWSDIIIKMNFDGYSNEDIHNFINHPLCTLDFIKLVLHTNDSLNRRQLLDPIMKRRIFPRDYIPPKNTAGYKLYKYITETYGKHPADFFKEYKGPWKPIWQGAGVPRHRLSRYRYNCLTGRIDRGRKFIEQYKTFGRRMWVKRILKTGMVETPTGAKKRTTIQTLRDLW